MPKTIKMENLEEEVKETREVEIDDEEFEEDEEDFEDEAPVQEPKKSINRFAIMHGVKKYGPKILKGIAIGAGLGVAYCLGKSVGHLESEQDYIDTDSFSIEHIEGPTAEIPAITQNEPEVVATEQITTTVENIVEE